jgi:electron transfer flavoprotein alpha subunit
MKALLVGESRDGKLVDNFYETLAFARKLGAETVHFLVGNEQALPLVEGTLYFADAAIYGEYNPPVHRDLLLQVIAKENPDLIVFCHSSYGWDLAPRLAWALKAAQVSEVINARDGVFYVPACNAKLRRAVRPNSAVTVVTVQAGAFGLQGEPRGTPQVVQLGAVLAQNEFEFVGYEEAEQDGIDLTKAEVIVSAGRGIGKPENLGLIKALARALGGEYGASRPVVDAGWAEHSRQVGSTGQTVAPKVYIACGISGAIQHLAGMKKAGFVVAINTDEDAPISEVADVLVVGDLKQVVPAITELLQGRAC